MKETFQSRRSRSRARPPGCSGRRGTPNCCWPLLKPPFLGGETRGRSSSLPQRSLPVSPGGRASTQTLLGTRLSSRKCPPFLWSLQSSEFTKPWTTQLTEANPAPDEPNMYMHFIFIRSFTLRDTPSVANGPAECRGLSRHRRFLRLPRGCQYAAKVEHPVPIFSYKLFSIDLHYC